MIRAGIAGGSGYAGLELVQILLRHPKVRLRWISSQQHAGKTPGQVYPSLSGFLDFTFARLEDLPESELDVLFLALPNGQAMRIVPQLSRKLILIDLSGDFRLSDPQIFERYYGFPMLCPQEQPHFVYGLTEINRENLASASRVANPGCFASATLLALYPLYRESWLQGPVFVDTKTGSSGSGNSPKAGTHHPRRSNSFYPYKPFEHQQLPEIEQVLDRADTPLIFQTYSAPMVRGIFASHYLQLAPPASAREVKALYQSYYGGDRFIRWVDGCPDVNFVRHSNFVDIGSAVRDRFLIVWSTLDNLQKGAAGQAVQNMNVICGFAEEMGLDVPPAHP